MQRTSRSGFGHGLKRELGVRVSFCTFLILTYYPDREPVSQYSWIGDPKLLKTYHSQYLSGAYRLDPYYQMAMRPFRPGFFRLRDIAPDRFYTSEYYHRYYAQTRLCDEVGVLVRQSDGSVSAISSSRDERGGPFSRSEVNGWRAIAPVITELLRQHAEKIHVSSAATKQTGGPDTAKLILNFSKRLLPKGLTRREAEISALILEGHSNLSISGHLNIATDTVKVHRRNIYRKLQISSQAELFPKLHAALISR